MAPVTLGTKPDRRLSFKAKGYIPLSWGSLDAQHLPGFSSCSSPSTGGERPTRSHPPRPASVGLRKPVIDALTLLERLAKAGVFPVDGIHDPQSYQLAYQGRAAMFYGGSWTSALCSLTSKDWLDNYSVHKVPASDRRLRPLHRRPRRRSLVGQRQEPEQAPGHQVHRHTSCSDVYNWRAKGLQLFPSHRQERRRSDRQSPRFARLILWITTGCCKSHPLRARQLAFNLQRLPGRPGTRTSGQGPRRSRPTSWRRASSKRRAHACLLFSGCVAACARRRSEWKRRR